MGLLNVSFGIYAFLPLGWMFMAFIILLECWMNSELLLDELFNKKIWVSTTITNIISGLIGIGLSMILNGGWWLVVWMPWVSKNEIDLSNPKELMAISIYYGIAFILTVLIEFNLNFLFLKSVYTKKKILRTTILSNVMSYIFGSFIMYIYSFYL
jgi:hypothetical protein